LYSLLGWLDKNWKQLASGAAVVIVIGIIVAYFIWRKGENEVAAGTALTTVLTANGAQGAASAPALLKVADDHAGTAAGARALLGAAGMMFAEGKAAEAQTQFQRFLSEYSENPLAAEAKLGVAACLESQGKTNEAVTAYKDIVDRQSAGNTALPAKFSLARLYESQGKLEVARDLYRDLAQNPSSLTGSEAAGRLSEMFRQHPELVPAAPALAPLTNAAPATAPK
jgi:predicted negative regulator of RcsB-dependent stress response